MLDVRRPLIVGLSVLGFLVAATITTVALLRHGPRSAPLCTLTANGGHYQLDRSQVANAVTVAQSAARLGLPHHAVTIALAAAFQESGVHNLTHGDRDSLGLFQQRPSQGWGTPAQLLDTRYASDAFLRALARVSEWQSLPVGDAAQRVQRSAAPYAYAQWEAEARALARVVTGEVVGGISCPSS